MFFKNTYIDDFVKIILEPKKKKKRQTESDSSSSQKL